jgi:hypothetical protein
MTYRDGVLLADVIHEDGYLPSNNFQYWIGRRQGSGYFTGKLDDVRFYDKALTVEEVLAIYNFGNGTEAE